MNPERYLPRALPPALKGLTDLALDLRWNWNHSADLLWRQTDPELWQTTGDPWLILESISRKRLEALAGDASFVQELQRQLAYRKTYLSRGSWFDERHGEAGLKTVAYFSMEFGLSEALPLYSGGLGVLAGDYLKTASDLGVPGRYRAALPAGLFPPGARRQWRPAGLLSPTTIPPSCRCCRCTVRTAAWLRVELELPGRTLQLRGWQAQVGRVTLYLLDSNDLLQRSGDRGITGKLYGGGTEMRLTQEIVLGIGGWRLLDSAGPRARGLPPQRRACGLRRAGTRPPASCSRRAHPSRRPLGHPGRQCLHHPHAGGRRFRSFPAAELMDPISLAIMPRRPRHLPATDLLALGSQAPGRRLGTLQYGLSGPARLRPGQRRQPAARRGQPRIFRRSVSGLAGAEVPVGHVTNGVHVPSWDSAVGRRALDRAPAARSRWLGTLGQPDRGHAAAWTMRQLWALPRQDRQELVRYARQRLARQLAASAAPPQEAMAQPADA